MVEVNGVELCTEPFGDPGDPPVLLVMGVSASMLWWDEGLCRLLAENGRFVIRYDHRDTGRSVTYEPGAPSTPVPIWWPMPSGSLMRMSYPPCMWSASRRVGVRAVGYQRMLAGGARAFDEAGWRELVRRDVERAGDIAASQNHSMISKGDVPAEPISSIAAPTLVIHGTADPMFPLAHGEALAKEIPRARLLTLEGAGHGVDRADWGPIARAIVAHTAAADRGA